MGEWNTKICNWVTAVKKLKFRGFCFRQCESWNCCVMELKNVGSYDLSGLFGIAYSRNYKGMVTSFRRNDLWDRLGGQTLVMIGRWYSRQQLANYYKRFSTQTISKNRCAEISHPFPSYSFWSVELGSLLTHQFLILLVSIPHGLKY